MLSSCLLPNVSRSEPEGIKETANHHGGRLSHPRSHSSDSCDPQQRSKLSPSVPRPETCVSESVGIGITQTLRPHTPSGYIPWCGMPAATAAMLDMWAPLLQADNPDASIWTLGKSSMDAEVNKPRCIHGPANIFPDIC